MARDEFLARQPLKLVAVAYSRHVVMSAELRVEHRPGGALFLWDVVDSDFARVFDGLADWLGHLAEMIESGSFEMLESGGAGLGRCVRLTAPWSEPASTQPGFGRDILEWPEHWQRAAGIGPEHLHPRGATHTIAEVIESPPGERVQNGFRLVSTSP